jgi:hypothetical protein
LTGIGVGVLVVPASTVATIVNPDDIGFSIGPGKNDVGSGELIDRPCYFEVVGQFGGERSSCPS